MEQEEASKKRVKALRFSIIWTLFFIILGLVFQSIKQKTFVFGAFFSTNYLAWFQSFGNFTDVVVRGSDTELISAIFNSWYYFFITGGLISLLWALLSLLFHMNLKKNTEQKTETITEETIIKKEALKTESSQQDLEKEFSRELSKILEDGIDFLSQNKLVKAEDNYNLLRKKYKKELDSNQKLYKRILDFYDEILREKEIQGKKQLEEWEG
jgi:hypothetical protein